MVDLWVLTNYSIAKSHTLKVKLLGTSPPYFCDYLLIGAYEVGLKGID
jgi:hypothetical protein